MSAPNIFTSSIHEQDPRWSAVDAYTFSHLHPPSRPNHEGLVHALEYSRDNGLPDIASNPVLGKFLALQCRIGNVKHGLEVGTLGGYASIWLTTLNPNLRVTTLEVDEKYAAIARVNFEKAGVSDRIELIVGPALEILPKLLSEVESGQRPRFGFTYVDADKENNWTYLNLAIQMSAPGSGLYVDNVVWSGGLVDPEKQDDDGVIGARNVIEKAGKDPRVEAVVLQTVTEKTYDGFLMVVLK